MGMAPGRNESKHPANENKVDQPDEEVEKPEQPDQGVERNPGVNTLCNVHLT